MIKFISNKPYLYIRYGAIPNYPIKNYTMSISGITFSKDCEFETDDEILISGLREYIKKHKNSPIIEEGQEFEIQETLQVTEEAENSNDKEDVKARFEALLRL